MQTLIMEGSEFLNLLKLVCPKYQFYNCFFRINIRVRISEPCKIQILQTLLKMQTLIIEGSQFLNLLKLVCPKYQFYSCFFRINIRVGISEPRKILAYVIDHPRFLVGSMQLARKACPRIRHVRLRFCINLEHNGIIIQ